MRALFGAGSSDSSESRLAEIDEELLFHLRSRIEDNRASGMNEDEAWNDARRRLGSYRGSLEECHEVRFGGARRVAAGIVAAALVLVACGWLLTDGRAKGLAAQQSVIAGQLDVLAAAVNQTAVVAATFADSGPQDFETQVVYKGQPIKDADVLVILKTWPNNRYRQEPYHAKTGADGRAKFEKLIPAEGQFAVHAAVVHEGHTLTSAYHLFKAGNRDLKAIKPLELAVENAQTMRFQLQDHEGKPVVNAHVAPASRKAGKAEHLVYFDAASPVAVTSNAEGEVTLSCFARGDDVELFVTPAGRMPTQAKCKIPKDGDVVKVTVPAPRPGE